MKVSDTPQSHSQDHNQIEIECSLPRGMCPPGFSDPHDARDTSSVHSMWRVIRNQKNGASPTGDPSLPVLPRFPDQLLPCSPPSPPSPLPCPLLPANSRATPNVINPSALCKTNRRPLSLRTSIPQTLGQPVSLRASQQSYCPLHLRCPRPSTAPWGGTGRSMWPLHFLGWACWRLEILTLPCSANYATLVTGFVT